MHKVLKYQKIVAGLLVSLSVLPLFPLAVLAQTTPVAGSSNGQSGNALSSIVQDTTGAVAAAAIACNKQNIHSGISNLFSGNGSSGNDEEDDTTDEGYAAEVSQDNAVINQAENSTDTGGSTLDGSSLDSGGSAFGGGSGLGDSTAPSLGSASTDNTTILDSQTDADTTTTTTAVDPTDTDTTTSDQEVHLSQGSSANTNIAKIASSTAKIAAAANATANATAAQTNKVTCADAIEKAAAGVILRQLTISTVNWINHGLNGNPFYSTNTASALKSVRDTAIKSLANTLGFDSKNYPFGKAIAQSIANQVGSSYEQQAVYSLNAVIANKYPGMTSADFQRNFGIGGWDAFLSQTALNNNPFGFSMQAQNVAATRIADTSYSPAQDLKDQLARSGGFFDQKVCADPNYNPKADIQGTGAAEDAASDKADAADAAVAAAENDYAAAQIADGTDPATLKAVQNRLIQAQQAQAQADTDLQKASAAVQTVNAQSQCKNWVVQTPGSTIGQQLTKALGATNDTLINGQNLSTDITAIFNALMNQLINKGLSSLSTTNTNAANFTNNSNGTTANNSSVDVSGEEGSWASQGSNFNVFTDIPSVIRYEDNSQNNATLASGCTTAGGFSPTTGQFCTGDPTLPEGYQQILAKEINAERNLVTSIYELDYCIPGPRPGAIDTIDTNAHSFVQNPNQFPTSADAGALHKFLSNYGKTIGVLAGAATGAAIGSALGPWGTVIGAVAGAITGAILTAIGNDHNFTNEKAYGPFVGAILGFDVDYTQGGRAAVNGYGNASNIIPTLATRYKEAMEMTYAPTQGDVSAAEAAATANPTGRDTAESNTDLNDKVPDLSTTNAARLKIVTAGYNALSGGAQADLYEAVSLDATEYGKIPSHTSNVDQNATLYANSQSVEGQLERLMVRISKLPSQDGYPGLTGPLDLVPVITLNGSKIMTLNVGDAFTDPGATASDKTDGDITSKIVTVGNVNTSAAGIYTVTYDVTDSQGINAVQATRSVRVVDASGSVGHIVVNAAVKDYSAANTTAALGGEGGNTNIVSSTATVRDYNKDLQAIQNISNIATLTPYEAELRRISNTFQQLAPYVHGVDDLKQEEATLDIINNEASQIAVYPAGTSLDGEPASGMLKDCIDDTAAGSQYQKDGGPLGRIPFSFVTSNSDTVPYSIPSWLTTMLPPSMSFLPDWHFAGGSNDSEGKNYTGFQLFGKNWFPGDGYTVPADQAGKAFFFPYFDGDNMTGPTGPSTVDVVSVDYDKLIRNNDVVTINNQPVQNGLMGLENIVGMY